MSKVAINFIFMNTSSSIYKSTRFVSKFKIKPFEYSLSMPFLNKIKEKRNVS